MTSKIFKMLKGRSIIKRNNLIVVIALFIIAAVPVTNASFQSMQVLIDNNVKEIVEDDIFGVDSFSYTLEPLSPPVTIEKKVRKDSDDPWADSITAHIGNVLEFQINAKNTKLLARSVVITDIFPSMLNYVDGSAIPDPSEYFNESEEGLIWLLSIGGLQTKTFTFKAKIVELGSDENYVVVAPLTGGDSDEDTVSIYSANDPPNTPSTPSGPTILLPNEEGEYCTSATDPDNDKVKIRFDWDAEGLHNYSDWSSLVDSGTEICMNHLWESTGQYIVKAQAQDEFDNTSEWSNGFSVIVNNPPNTPNNPDPEDGEIDVGINSDLTWECNDPDEDEITYDVYFEANDPTPDEKVSANQSETTFDPGKMDGHTNYYWKIVAWDEHGVLTNGPIWNFTTEESSEDIYPFTFEIVRGNHMIGSLSDLYNSDDSYLVIEPGITLSNEEPPVWLRVFGTSATSNPSELSFTLESCITKSGEISQTIQLYNYNTEKYETVDSRQASANDEVVKVVITDNISRFIDSSTLELKAQIRYIQTGPVSGFPWWIKFDQIIWKIAF